MSFQETSMSLKLKDVALTNSSSTETVGEERHSTAVLHDIKNVLYHNKAKLSSASYDTDAVQNISSFETSDLETANSTNSSSFAYKDGCSTPNYEASDFMQFSTNGDDNIQHNDLNTINISGINNLPQTPKTKQYNALEEETPPSHTTLEESFVNLITPDKSVNSTNQNMSKPSQPSMQEITDNEDNSKIETQFYTPKLSRRNTRQPSISDEESSANEFPYCNRSRRRKSINEKSLDKSDNESDISINNTNLKLTFNAGHLRYSEGVINKDQHKTGMKDFRRSLRTPKPQVLYTHNHTNPNTAVESEEDQYIDMSTTKTVENSVLVDKPETSLKSFRTSTPLKNALATSQTPKSLMKIQEEITISSAEDTEFFDTTYAMTTDIENSETFSVEVIDTQKSKNEEDIVFNSTYTVADGVGASHEDSEKSVHDLEKSQGNIANYEEVDDSSELSEVSDPYESATIVNNADEHSQPQQLCVLSETSETIESSVGQGNESKNEESTFEVVNNTVPESHTRISQHEPFVQQSGETLEEIDESNSVQKLSMSKQSFTVFADQEKSIAVNDLSKVDKDISVASLQIESIPVESGVTLKMNEEFETTQLNLELQNNESSFDISEASTGSASTEIFTSGQESTIKTPGIGAAQRIDNEKKSVSDISIINEPTRTRSRSRSICLKKDEILSNPEIIGQESSPAPLEVKELLQKLGTPSDFDLKNLMEIPSVNHSESPRKSRARSISFKNTIDEQVITPKATEISTVRMQSTLNDSAFTEMNEMHTTVESHLFNTSDLNSTQNESILTISSESLVDESTVSQTPKNDHLNQSSVIQLSTSRMSGLLKTPKTATQASEALHDEIDFNQASDHLTRSSNRQVSTRKMSGILKTPKPAAITSEILLNRKSDYLNRLSNRQFSARKISTPKSVTKASTTLNDEEDFSQRSEHINRSSSRQISGILKTPKPAIMKTPKSAIKYSETLFEDSNQRSNVLNRRFSTKKISGILKTPKPNTTGSVTESNRKTATKSSIKPHISGIPTTSKTPFDRKYISTRKVSFREPQSSRNAYNVSTSTKKTPMRIGTPAHVNLKPLSDKISALTPSDFNLSEISEFQKLCAFHKLSSSAGRTPRPTKQPHNKLTIADCAKQLFQKPSIEQKHNSSQVGLNSGVAIKMKARYSTKFLPGGIAQKSPRNDFSNLQGVKQLLGSSRKKQKSPENNLDNVGGLKRLMKTPKLHKSPKNDLVVVEGVKRLMKTPKVLKSPENDLSDVGGVKQLLRSSKKPQKSPENDLRNIKGVRQLMKTPKIQKSPKNDLNDVSGVGALMKSPFIDKSSKNDLSDLGGVNQFLRSSKRQQKSPENDLRNIKGVRQLMKTPKTQKSPKNDLTQITGVKELFRGPMKSPLNDLNNVRGVKALMKSPFIVTSPRNDLSDLRGVKQLLGSSKKQQKSPKNDLRNIKGVKRLMKTPKIQKSPLNDLSNVRGIKMLMSTPKQDSLLDPLENMYGLRKLFNIPKEQKSPNVDLRTLFAEDDADKSFDELINKKPLKTYPGKSSPVKQSLSPHKLQTITMNNFETSTSPYVEQWVNNLSSENTKEPVRQTRSRKIAHVASKKSVHGKNVKQNRNKKSPQNLKTNSDESKSFRSKRKSQNINGWVVKIEQLNKHELLKGDAERKTHVVKRGRPRKTKNSQNIEDIKKVTKKLIVAPRSSRRNQVLPVEENNDEKLNVKRVGKRVIKTPADSTESPVKTKRILRNKPQNTLKRKRSEPTEKLIETPISVNNNSNSRPTKQAKLTEQKNISPVKTRLRNAKAMKNVETVEKSIAKPKRVQKSNKIQNNIRTTRTRSRKVN